MQSQSHLRRWLKYLGPGLVTGAADDDPSGVATYAQAGARFGYGLLWAVLLTTPLMLAVQLVSAHRPRHRGWRRRQYPRPSAQGLRPWARPPPAHGQCRKHRR